MSERNSFIKATETTDERLETLKQLYPEIFSDGNINLDAFMDVTNTSTLPDGQDKTPGYYGLYWPGKRSAKQLARKEAEGTLVPVIGDGVNEDSTHNIYIEGDNLEVLRILKQSYKGRVKMIYIDPPYNRGSDFIYPDDFRMPVEEYLKMTGQMDEQGKKLVTNTKSSGAFHSNWLNMMYPRLQLARELLTEDGVILINIDDNEQANLKLLCDDIFGEENSLINFIWELPRGINAGYISKAHEYIITYARNINHLKLFIKQNPENSIERCNKKIDSRHPESAIRFPKGIAYEGKDQLLTGVIGGSERIRIEGELKFQNGLLAEPVTLYAGWTMKNMILDWLKGNKVYDLKGQQIQRFFFKENGKLYSEKIIKADSPKSILKGFGDSQSARKELFSLFTSEDYFDYPKPTNLLKQLTSYISSENDIILDFFSGSGTTAHAVTQLNAEDGGNRKFIMVQIPETTDEKTEAFKAGYKTICEIGKERIRRAGTKILEEAKSKDDMFTTENALDIGFKVFRLQKSNFVKYTPVEGQDEQAKNSLFAELENNITPLVDGWKTENVLTEIILRQGFALDCTKEKLTQYTKNTVYKITDSPDAVSKKIALYICLDSAIAEETIKTLSLGDDEKFICLDSAIDDSSYARLCDKGRIETI